MWRIIRLCLLWLCPGILALTGCTASQTEEAVKAKAQAEAAKAELAQVKSDLVKRGQGGRFQLFMDSKGGTVYLFDSEKGQVLSAPLKSGTASWSIAARSARE
jgi:hypothetical protein